MALIPIHSKRPVPADLCAILLCAPVGFTDDGLSNFPDSVFGWDISKAGRGHDIAYCTRSWQPGTMDRAHKEKYDAKIGEWVRALLPFGLRLTGYLVFLGVYELGGRAFNSCGYKPYGATAGQMAAGLCRHNVSRPAWMQAAED